MRTTFLSRHPQIILMAAGIVLLIPMILLSDFPQPDVFMRYAPMADAFAEGDWVHALHPRIPPLFSILTGSIAWLGSVDGFFATQLFSVLCFVLTLFPLYALMTRVARKQIALLCCTAYLFCPYLLRLASSGLRETPKTLGFLCAVHALFLIWQERARLRGYLYLGAALAFMTLIRDDSACLACLFLSCAAACEIAAKRLPWRSVMAGVFFLLLLSPALVIIYKQTGYPVPSARFVTIAQSIIPPYSLGGKPESPAAPQQEMNGSSPDGAGGSPVRSDESGFALSASPEDAIDAADAQKFYASISAKAIKRFIEESIKGNYPVFLFLALFSVIRRKQRKMWTRPETFVLLLWAGYFLVQVLQIAIFDHYLYMDRRYLLPAAPLLFLWTAFSLESAYLWLAQRYTPATGRKLALLAGTVFAAGLFLDAMSPLIQARCIAKYSSKREAVMYWAERIRQDYQRPQHVPPTAPSLEVYRSGKRPLVVCKALPELGYFSDGESVLLTPEQAQPLHYLHADYLTKALSPDDGIPHFPGYELLDQQTFRGYRFALWKRAAPPPGDEH